MKFIRVLILFINFISICRVSKSQDLQISAATRFIFDRLQTQGVNTDDDFLYSFLFQDAQRSKLDKLARNAVKIGWQNRGMERNKKGYFVLTIAQIMRHTPQSITMWEDSMRALAAQYNLAYIGWDISNIDPTKPIVPQERFGAIVRSKPESELFGWGKKLFDYQLYEQAIAVFKRCVKLNIYPDSALFKIASCEIQLGKPEDGIKELKSVLKINPNYYSALLNLGSIFYEKGKFEYAIEYYEKAKQANPNEAKVWFMLASCQTELSRYDEAYINSQKSVEIDPENALYLFLYAKLKIHFQEDPCEELKKVKKVGGFPVDALIRKHCRPKNP